MLVGSDAGNNKLAEELARWESTKKDVWAACAVFGVVANHPNTGVSTPFSNR